MFRDSNNLRTAQSLTPGAVVACAAALHGVQSPGGDLVPCDRLGPGVVADPGTEGRVLVWWPLAGFQSWLEADELRALGPDAHLVMVHRCDKTGESKLIKHKVLGGLGLRHNWTVELRPRAVVRVVRADGQAWTFTKNPIFSRITTPAWTTPPNDEDAEALAAAEFSLFK